MARPPIDLPPPDPGCTVPIVPVDVSQPQTVVGDGTPAGCNEAALTAAVSGGGIITFRCGPAPVTIGLLRELRIQKDTVLDGGGRVTLSGQRRTRILFVDSDVGLTTPLLTVQKLRLVDGYAGGVGAAGDRSLGGAAIYRLGGSLRVVDSQFEDNHGAATGADEAGGAIFARGGGATTIVGSVFRNNSCANGGAIGAVGHGLQLVNSLVYENRATGVGGSSAGGGGGGGLYIESAAAAVSLCGVYVGRNEAGAAGGGLFHRGEGGAVLRLARTNVEDNRIAGAAGSRAGGVYASGVTALLSQTSLLHNSAESGGGMYIDSGVLELTNTTLASNTALSGSGGGLVIGGGVSGRIWNSSIIDNRAPGSTAVGGGIDGGSGAITLQNTIVADNRVGGGGAMSCSAKLTGGGLNYQWPVSRTGGGSDAPDALCADGVVTENPGLWFGVAALGAGANVLAWPLYCGGRADFTPTTGCPPVDAFDTPRDLKCRAGASERCFID
jgi:hypothetical protein